VLAGDIGPEPPIHRSTFFAGGNIGPVSHPIHFEWMGLSGGGDIVASCSFGGTWGILLLLVLLKAFFWETIFLVKGYLLYVFLSFGSFG
jgi:hypothetical protein